MVLLEREQQKSEQLLLNVLPPSIVTLLKDNDRTIARHHGEASIMFADIADFTLLSATLPPGEVVEMLNGVFTKFDQLTEKQGLEKIKTIGDSYMVAAGVPEARPDHAEVLAELALEMMAAVSTQTFNGQRLVLRIGINSGPVVSSGPHHQDSGEAKIRESTAGVSRKPSSEGKARGCSSKHLCGLTAWNT